MKIEQFVMAYGVEQDKIRAILPQGFISLRPVFRINAEIKDNKKGYLEFNTAVEKDGIKGWLNIANQDNIYFEKTQRRVVFTTENLNISFTKVGITGGCPAEKDNQGCFYLNESEFKKAEIIMSNKEFCDCEFKWNFGKESAFGKSIGKTLQAIPTSVSTVYPKMDFTLYNAATIPCDGVLGAYWVEFDRKQ